MRMPVGFRGSGAKVEWIHPQARPNPEGDQDCEIQQGQLDFCDEVAERVVEFLPAFPKVYTGRF
jgi:hypothetical protein